MRYVTINVAQPGMRPANNILDSKGNLLLQAGTVLTEAMLYKLYEFGVRGIYIADDATANIKITEALPYLIRKKALVAITMQDVDACVDTSKDIVNELYDSDITTIDMMDLYSGDNLTATHSVNVAITSCIIGMKMGLGRKDVEYLVTAALLHDIGKYQIPEEIITKPGRLTHSEYSLVKEHPKKAFDALSKNPTIPSQIRVAILSHHENVDGSGYPKGISGDEQTLFSKILHVADVYDALVSIRPFKKPYSPREASEYLMGACGIMFDKNVVEQFIKYIALYPKGSEVLLSTGEKGYVFENTGIHNLRPVILMKEGGLLDLSKAENLSISIINDNPDNMMAILKSENERRQMMNPEKARILVVDDMKTNLLLIKDILQADYDLTLTTSGKRAIDFFDQGNQADMILMDIDMPDMTGIEAAEIIMKRTNNSVPIVFVTSLGDVSTVLSCRKLGAAGYILRPYNPTFMRAEIERLLYRPME